MQQWHTFIFVEHLHHTSAAPGSLADDEKSQSHVRMLCNYTTQASQVSATAERGEGFVQGLTALSLGAPGVSQASWPSSSDLWVWL